MTFIHDDRDFPQLLNLVTEETRITPALVEKEPALLLSDAERRVAVDRALARISTMFWGPRIPIDEARATIREWIRGNLA